MSRPPPPTAPPSTPSNVDAPSPARIARALSLGLSTPRVGDVFGSYELVRHLGQGGMGTVFEAVHPEVDQHVAIKFMLEGERAGEEEIRAFIAEAEKQVHLRHANIASVMHVETKSTPYYFTMPLYRRSLAAAMGPSPGALPADWRTRTRLMVAVARAVQHAHKHDLLHRDLKPANILLDDADGPVVADFGLAARLGDGGGQNGSLGGPVGTLPYMAPEQAAGRKDLTFAADVYGLGAILYELLTGERPFGQGDSAKLIARILGDEIVPPVRARNAAVPRDLERVCAKCLARDREDRYVSAEALALDLECVLAGRAPTVPPASVWARPIHAVRRHRRTSLVVVALVTLVIAIALTLQRLSESAAQAERDALDTNAFIASGLAGAVLSQLQELADRVHRAAGDPFIVASAIAAPTEDTPGPLQDLAGAFNAAFVIGGDGRLKIQWPPARAIYGWSYDFRDYYRGAASLAPDQVHVARAFLSERDDEVKFGVSTPLFDRGHAVGVLVAIVATDSVFGKVRMQDEGTSGRKSALLAPRDLDRKDPRQWPPPETFVFLVHEGLAHGSHVDVQNSPAVHDAFREAALPGEQLWLRSAPPRRDADYVDPVPGYEGRWLAALAPVGGTGYVVVVQSRPSTPVHAVRAVVEHAWIGAGSIGAAGIGVLASAAWLRGRRRRRP